MRLGDRVVLLTSRPGRVAEEFPITIPRPRRIDSPEVANQAAAITAQLARGGSPSWRFVTTWHPDPRSRRRDQRRALGPRRARDGAAAEAEPRRGRSGPSLWPKLMAVAIALGIWQVVVWSGWKPDYVLPGRRARCSSPCSTTSTTSWRVSAPRCERAAIGFSARARDRRGASASRCRSRACSAPASGSMITGLQTMPSIVWFPLAIVLFPYSATARSTSWSCSAPRRRSPTASSAGSTTSSRCSCGPGGCSGHAAFADLRYVVFPAALPSFVGGLKQGWAFAWRSLLAGELLVARRRERARSVASSSSTASSPTTKA